MPIDRDQLLEDLRLWIPSDAPITDDQILAIAELVIAMVGDDEAKYGEVFCKTLEMIATRMLMQTAASTSSGNKKREKTDEVEVEWYNGGTSSVEQGWQNILDSLAKICPLYGYTPRRSMGIKIYPPKKCPPCPCPVPKFDKFDE